VRAGDELIADSTDAMLLAWYGPGKLPTYCLPAGDVRTDLFSPSQPPSEGFVVDHDVHVDGRTIDRAAQLLRNPPEPLTVLDGRWTFRWESGLTWYEEAMEVHVHARDTAKRVDVVPSDRHLRIEIDGVTVADSTRTHALFETGLPTRWYFPKDDVRLEQFSPSESITHCPYKGAASYWSATVGNEPQRHRDIAWSYADPIPECPRIAGLIAFFNERVDLYIDDVLQPRPRTAWSR
jgi:uncharacterized protein (DUF427 family)